MIRRVMFALCALHILDIGWLVIAYLISPLAGGIYHAIKRYYHARGPEYAGLVRLRARYARMERYRRD